MTTVTSPRISVNKLAEYVQATPTRRRAILKNLKADKDYFKLYYSEVRNILSSYFKSGYDNSILDKLIDKIQKKKGTSDWDDKDNPNSILALQCLKDTTLPDLTDYDISSSDDKMDHVMVAGVKVLIRPEFYLTNKFSKKIGGIKLHLAKTEGNRLNLPGMQYVAVMIKYGFLNHGYTESEIDNNGCFSIDVFEKNFGTAPKAYKRTLATLTASCQEIFAIWPTL